MIVEGWDVSLAYEIAASPDHGPDPGFLSDFFLPRDAMRRRGTRQRRYIIHRIHRSHQSQ